MYYEVIPNNLRHDDVVLLQDHEYYWMTNRLPDVLFLWFILDLSMLRTPGVYFLLQEFLKNPERYTRLGARPPRGILLVDLFSELWPLTSGHNHKDQSTGMKIILS